MTDGEIKSKYTLVDTDEGFVIEREGGIRIAVTYADTWLQVQLSTGVAEMPAVQVGLYGYNKMLQQIADMVLDATWKHYIRVADRKNGREMIRRALGKRVQPHWKRLVDEIVPKNVSQLAKKMWGSILSDVRILHEPDIYLDENKYAYADLMKYHACRLYAKCYDVTGVDTIAQWRQDLAGMDKPGKVINKILDNLPRGISATLMHNLRFIDFQKPITERVHLLALLYAAQNIDQLAMFQPVLLRADKNSIIEAFRVAQLAAHVPKRISPAQIQNGISYILDYPEPYNGDIVGLARRSSEWHENLYRNNQNRYLVESSLAEDTVLPLLQLDYDLLAEKGVKPLRTVGDVIDEGAHMRHCVGTYARYAYQGSCYLFHVDFEGHEATIEVSPDGQIRQAYGPMNERNDACDIGVVILSQCLANYGYKTNAFNAARGQIAMLNAGPGNNWIDDL